MPDLRQGSWDKQLERDLPDCRVRYADREKNIVMRGRMAFEKVFCASCHKEKGLVTAEWTAHVFFICDPCFAKMMKLPPPGCVEIKM